MSYIRIRKRASLHPKLELDGVLQNSRSLLASSKLFEFGIKSHTERVKHHNIKSTFRFFNNICSECFREETIGSECKHHSSFGAASVRDVTVTSISMGSLY